MKFALLFCDALCLKTWRLSCRQHWLCVHFNSFRAIQWTHNNNNNDEEENRVNKWTMILIYVSFLALVHSLPSFVTQSLIKAWCSVLGTLVSFHLNYHYFIFPFDCFMVCYTQNVRYTCSTHGLYHVVLCNDSSATMHT